MRLSFITNLLSVAALTAVMAPLHAQVGTRFQDFAANPNWTVAGSGTGGNNFGYSPTTFTGGSTGEAGGRFTRGNTFRYYADTALGGTLTLNHPISASGRFDHTAANTPDFVDGLYLGHFSSGADNYAIGIFFSNGGGDPSKLAWGVGVRGDTNNIVSTQTTINTNIDRDWSFTWNPTGGANGLGVLSATLSGAGGGTKSVDMPAGTFVRPNAVFDAFGLMATSVNATANSGIGATVYIDDVTYSVPVPEAKCLMVAAVLAALLGRLRSKC